METTGRIGPTWVGTPSHLESSSLSYHCPPALTINMPPSTADGCYHQKAVTTKSPWANISKRSYILPHIVQIFLKAWEHILSVSPSGFISKRHYGEIWMAGSKLHRMPFAKLSASTTTASPKFISTKIQTPIAPEWNVSSPFTNHSLPKPNPLGNASPPTRPHQPTPHPKSNRIRSYLSFRGQTRINHVPIQGK